LSTNTNNNITELSQIRVLVKTNEKNSIDNRNTQFITLVSQPVKQLIESNSDCFKSLQIASQRLNNNFQTSKAKLDQSIIMIALKQKNNINELNSMVMERVADFNEFNKQTQSNIETHKEASNQFFVAINRDNVDKKSAEISSLMKKSIDQLGITKSSILNLSEQSKEFYNSSINVISKFSEEDYSEDKSTGNSPPPKVYFRAVDFVRSKRDSILIEEYRARKNEQNALKDSLKVPSDSRGSSRPNSPDVISGTTADFKQEPISAHIQSKRPADSRENSKVEKNGINSTKNINLCKKMKTTPLVERN